VAENYRQANTDRPSEQARSSVLHISCTLITIHHRPPAASATKYRSERPGILTLQRHLTSMQGAAFRPTGDTQVRAESSSARGLLRAAQVPGAWCFPSFHSVKLIIYYSAELPGFILSYVFYLYFIPDCNFFAYFTYRSFSKSYVRRKLQIFLLLQ